MMDHYFSHTLSLSISLGECERNPHTSPALAFLVPLPRQPLETSTSPLREVESVVLTRPVTPQASPSGQFLLPWPCSVVNVGPMQKKCDV
ncbi:hypothetical protein BO70DRAFT_360715, partial [Aspergillus heteromorphus CBS 117.55]